MSHAPQSLKNHMRFRPAFHFFASPLLMITMVWAAIRFARTPSWDSGFMLLVVFGVALVGYWARAFALGVQDRLIRLEERLRLERLLPEDLRGRITLLTTDQLIGLRFASDAEVPELTRRVLAGELKRRKEIKAAVREWRADYERI